MLESEIQKQIIAYLNMENICNFRINTQGVIHKIGTKTIRKKNPNIGMADILSYVNGKTLWIEVKSLSGKQSKEQKEFEKKVTDEKCFYLLARDVDSVIKTVNIIRNTN